MSEDLCRAEDSALILDSKGDIEDDGKFFRHPRCTLPLNHEGIPWHREVSDDGEIIAEWRGDQRLNRRGKK